MSSREKPQNHHNFDSCVRELSKRIGFEQPEKLCDFIRRAVQWLLEETRAAAKKSRKATAKNGITFQARFSTILTSEFDLDFYCNNGREAEKPIAAIKFRDGFYKGLPDDHPEIKHIEDLPPLVARRMIYAKELRNGSEGDWITIKHSDDKDLKLDLQLNGKK